MVPWSVMPIAGWPSATALATSSSRRAAPSSIENSVWTWRWVNESGMGLQSEIQPCGSGDPTNMVHHLREAVRRLHRDQVADAVELQVAGTGDQPRQAHPVA